MSKESYSKHKGSNGKTYETRSKTYDSGTTIHKTREQGGLFGSGKLVKVTTTRR